MTDTNEDKTRGEKRKKHTTILYLNEKTTKYQNTWTKISVLFTE